MSWSRSGRNAGGSGGTGGRSGSQRHYNKQRKMTVKIIGLKERPLLGDLGKMLSSATHRQIRWTHADIRHDNTVLLTFDTPSEVSSIIRQRHMTLNHVRVTATLCSDFRCTPEQRQALLQLIGSKFTAVPTPFLDLNALPIESIIPNLDLNDKGVVDVICEIIRDNCGSVQTIRLDGNGIRTLAAWDSLPDAAPSLLNLSLSDNKLESLDELDHLHLYSTKLAELVLTGNPLPNWSSQIINHIVCSKFPSIRLLNGIPCESFMQLPVPSYIDSPLPTLLGSSFDPPNIEQLARSVIVKYYEVQIGSRDTLIQLYSDDAYFSLTISDPSLRQKYAPSRNLMKLSGWSSRQSALKRGKHEIASALKSLPYMHTLPQTLIADVSVLSSSQIIISMTGQFMENSSSSDILREFHRVFVMLSAGNGWLISNDHLHVLHSDSVRPGPPSADLVLQLAQHAHCTAERAYQALVTANGDPQIALQRLQQTIK